MSETPDPAEKIETNQAQPTCKTAADDEAECPQCEGSMRLWAGFYRCPNCGYKESCCF